LFGVVWAVNSMDDSATGENTRQGSDTDEAGSGSCSVAGSGVRDRFRPGIGFVTLLVGKMYYFSQHLQACSFERPRSKWKDSNTAGVKYIRRGVWTVLIWLGTRSR
jgi:hypothetical protein